MIMKHEVVSSSKLQIKQKYLIIYK